MCALLSYYPLYDPRYLSLEDAASSYHDDGLEIADDAAISKQRAHVRFLALYGFSYFAEFFYFSGSRKPVGSTLPFFGKTFCGQLG